MYLLIFFRHRILIDDTANFSFMYIGEQDNYTIFHIFLIGLAGQQPVRNIPQQFEDDAFPPPPPVRPGNGNTTIPSSGKFCLFLI